MKIGLYGLPAAGKTTVLDKIDFMEVLSGSQLLRVIDPSFDKQDEDGKNAVRKQLAARLMEKQDFIMDGHYAFGSQIAFTEQDGQLYDAFVYLYIDPDILRNRMLSSEKNQKYLSFDLREWQLNEIDSLRQYCHKHFRDFYVVDNPPSFQSEDCTVLLKFLKHLKDGFSCRRFAEECAGKILEMSAGEEIVLLDGDKTLINEDSSSVVFNYRTRLYDGNFYTGYQSWKQFIEFESYKVPLLREVPVNVNKRVEDAVTEDTFILTSGHPRVWKAIAERFNLPAFYGHEMSAETKLFIVRYLQEAGKKVIAYGDGMNDYYMVRQADNGYLVRRLDGSLSRSLKGKDLEGCRYV